MLGIIGEEERFQGTLISDAFNVASRLEALLKSTGHAIILSEAVASDLEHDFTLQHLGRASWRAKSREQRCIPSKAPDHLTT